MKLPDLLEFINNLNQEFDFYLKFDNQIKPLSKLTITATECLLYPGKKAMKKKQIIKLVKNMHKRSLRVWIVVDNQKLPIYGLQIDNQNGKIFLM